MRFIKLAACFLALYLTGCTSEKQRQAEYESLQKQQMEELIFEMQSPESVSSETNANTYESSTFTTVFDKPEDLPNACIPIINDLWSSEDRSIYDYLMDHLDTLSPKNQQHDDQGYECAFSREFTNGVYYHESYCGEGGWDMGLETMCPDKDILYYLLTGLYNGGDYIWNADSTEFGTADGGAGCYYRIVLDDGFYSIAAYCGC